MCIRDRGYTGKICIHPAQLSPVNQAFTPTAAEVERARKIVAAAEDQGKGAIVVDGRLVDPPVVKIAQRVVDTAKHLSGSSAVQ